MIEVPLVQADRPGSGIRQSARPTASCRYCLAVTDQTSCGRGIGGRSSAMPFSSPLSEQRNLERVRAMRQNPLAAYGIAVLAVGLATLARWAVGEHVIAGVPFITYYPAIILATFLGGLWPGILAVILSSAA